MAYTKEQLEAASRAAEEFDPDAPDVVVTDTSDLRAITEAADAARRDEALLLEKVTIARAHGRSWTWIATCLGVSRQAARQRFADKVNV
jgi:hypothetical protein